MIKLSVVCCVLFFGGLTIADNVPALIWGPFNHYTPAVALKSYDGDEFIGILKEHATPDTFTLIIAENQLSTEDLSQCRTAAGSTCFKGMQQLKSKLYLPSVADPLPILVDVAGNGIMEVSLLSNGALSEPLAPEAGKFVFINFDDDGSDETKSAKLERHDELITKLYSELSAQNVKLMIIYTGRRAEHQKRVVRQAVSQASSTTAATTSATTATTTKAATTAATQPKQTATPGIFWKHESLLMYYDALQSVDSAEVATNIEVNSVTVNVDGIAAGRIVVSLAAGTNTLAFNISGDGGYWMAHEFLWNNQPILLHTRIAAMDTFSFHCSPIIEIGTLNKNIQIQWSGLQIQPQFGAVADQTFDAFGDSWDCVGFVSPGIVGGLFVVIMLLFILSIGISWMMDINTMDRFDDPKGKTITISVNE